MNKFSVFIILIFTPFIKIKAAPPNSVLVCLGKEELLLHKSKNFGPSYKLNQLFISELSSNTTLILKKAYAKKICRRPQSTSIRLLKHLLMQKGNIFYKSESFDSAFSFVQNIDSHLPKIFFGFVAQVQAIAPNAKCLDNNIPHLTYLKNRFQYLEDILEEKAIFEHKRKIFEAFSMLEEYPKVLRKCKRKN